MKYEVIVELKKEVLDTEGQTISNTLKRLGFDELEDIKVSKRFVLTFKDNTQKPINDIIATISKQYLSNPISENYIIHEITENENK